MAMIDEGLLQGNIQNILSVLRKQEACSCDNVATALWVTSSIAGVVFLTISGKGKIQVYNQPGGTLITNYGTITPH